MGLRITQGLGTAAHGVRKGTEKLGRVGIEGRQGAQTVRMIPGPIQTRLDQSRSLSVSEGILAAGGGH